MSRQGYTRLFGNKYQVALALLAIAAFFFLMLADTSRAQPFSSSEVGFSDVSSTGLEIVPASCASYPHYAGECTAEDLVPLQCSLTSNAWVITEGQSATLTWWGPQGTSALGVPITYVSGTINPSVGTVAQTGSAVVAPTVTTIYRYTGQQAWGGLFRSSFECNATITVLPAQYCPSGQVLGSDGLCRSATCPSGQYLGSDNICRTSTCPSGQVLGTDGLCHTNNCPAPFLFCGSGESADNLYQRTYSSAPACAVLDSFYAVCRYGCLNGSCIAAPTVTDATLSVRPSLVRVGNTSQVTWSSVDASSCSVSAPNGDSWTGNTGTQITSPIEQQTTYTLTCVPNIGGASVVKTATVNILPTFDEQ